MSIKDKYAIVGVGYTPQGKIPERTALSFHVEACAEAIKDAGLTREDIDGLISYRHFPPAPNEEDVTPYRVAQQLGLTPNVLGQEANCARTQVLSAIGWLEAGLCRYVVISYGDNPLSSTMNRGERFPRFATSAAYGHFGAVGGYALAARRGMHVFGTGPDTWQEIAVAQRKWANLNPIAAHYKQELTYDDYQKFPWVIEPLRRPDCCLTSDGGRAIVITSLERARQLKHPPALIMGIGAHNPSYEIHQSEYMAGPTGAKVSGQTAFNMAGITPADVDAAQIYDCFTYTVELTLQDYGFFEPGGGKDWLKGGTTAPGGRLPVNTSGGQLAEAYFMGLTQLSEGAMQIMGRCGERQLGPATNTREPGIILCSDNGAILQTHATVILRRL